MTRDIKLLATVTLIGGSVALSGCADAIYPRLPGLGGSSSANSSLLSPTEQKKTIDDLTAEQKSHGTAAAKEIERRE
jgi:hypothetical protein